MKQPYLTPTDLARLSRCYTRATLSAMAKRGDIRFERVNPEGQHYRYRDSPEIRQWARQLRLTKHLRRNFPPDFNFTIEMTKQLMLAKAAMAKMRPVAEWTPRQARRFVKEIGPIR